MYLGNCVPVGSTKQGFLSYSSNDRLVWLLQVHPGKTEFIRLTDRTVDEGYRQEHEWPQSIITGNSALNMDDDFPMIA